MNRHIDIIATTISGSIKDWGKIERLIPLFKTHGEEDISLFTVDSHLQAREKACELVRNGTEILISAGGSGTFNSVLEGCYDAEVSLSNLKLGFLRKGSADLIGKVLNMPDEVEEAVMAFVSSIRENRVIPCDVILVQSTGGNTPARRFAGYSGAELFGEIPYFTENRFVKYYKGILSQLFGDLGPFFIGTCLAITRRIFTRLAAEKRQWRVVVDDKEVLKGCFQSIIIVNGDLGPNLPFAKSVPLGSGDFYVFTIEDIGLINLFRQLKHAWDASIMEDPDRWGFKSFCVKKNLEIIPDSAGKYPVNVDGATMECIKSARFELADKIYLLTNAF